MHEGRNGRMRCGIARYVLLSFHFLRLPPDDRPSFRVVLPLSRHSHHRWDGLRDLVYDFFITFVFFTCLYVSSKVLDNPHSVRLDEAPAIPIKL